MTLGKMAVEAGSNKAPLIKMSNPLGLIRKVREFNSILPQVLNKWEEISAEQTYTTMDIKNQVVTLTGLSVEDILELAGVTALNKESYILCLFCAILETTMDENQVGCKQALLHEVSAHPYV